VKTTTSILMTFAALGVLAVMTPAAHASTILFTTGSADFTFGTNTLTLVLKDTVVNPNDIGFDLSGFKFTIAGSTGGVLASSSGLERTIASDGTFTDGASVATGWLFSDSSGTITLNDLGGDGPAHTIVGAPGGDGKYTGNASILGNGPHNPYLVGSVTFNFTFTGGVNADSLPTNIAWEFGTAPGFVAGSSGESPVSEPISLSLVGGGLLALRLLRKRALASRNSGGS
jgi:hypothetical protein